MMNAHATHTCNWEEYLISLQEMMTWLVPTYDQANYARWLPDFWAKLTLLNAKFLSSNLAQSYKQTATPELIQDFKKAKQDGEALAWVNTFI